MSGSQARSEALKCRALVKKAKVLWKEHVYAYKYTSADAEKLSELLKDIANLEELLAYFNEGVIIWAARFANTLYLLVANTTPGSYYTELKMYSIQLENLWGEVAGSGQGK